MSLVKEAQQSEEAQKAKRKAWYLRNREQIKRKGKQYRMEQRGEIQRKKKIYRRRVARGAIIQKQRGRAGMGYVETGVKPRNLDLGGAPGALVRREVPLV